MSSGAGWRLIASPLDKTAWKVFSYLLFLLERYLINNTCDKYLPHFQPRHITTHRYGGFVRPERAHGTTGT